MRKIQKYQIRNIWISLKIFDRRIRAWRKYYQIEHKVAFNETKRVILTVVDYLQRKHALNCC